MLGCARMFSKMLNIVRSSCRVRCNTIGPKRFQVWTSNSLWNQERFQEPNRSSNRKDSLGEMKVNTRLFCSLSQDLAKRVPLHWRFFIEEFVFLNKQNDKTARYGLEIKFEIWKLLMKRRWADVSWNFQVCERRYLLSGSRLIEWRALLSCHFTMLVYTNWNLLSMAISLHLSPSLEFIRLWFEMRLSND